MRRTILKLTLFLVTLVVLVEASKGILDGYFSSKTIHHEINSVHEGSIVFLGSSRVMHGVNENLLNRLHPTRTFHNLAIPSGTFLSNCIMADWILDNGKSQVIVIELSPIVPGLPTLVHELLDYHEPEFLSRSDEKPGIFSFYDPMFYLNFQTSRVYEKISLLETFRKVRDEISDTSHPVFGYVEYPQNNYRKSDSFLVRNDIAPMVDLTPGVGHSFLIAEIEKKAREKNVDILFMLPITYNSKEELNIIAPVFHALTESNTIVFDDTFFENVTKSEYLWDRNHFNARGAEVYSQQILRLLQEKGY